MQEAARIRNLCMRRRGLGRILGQDSLFPKHGLTSVEERVMRRGRKRVRVCRLKFNVIKRI